MIELRNPEDEHIRYTDLSPHIITANLRSNFWKKIICYKAVDSTNELALARVPKSSESDAVIVADSQARGRGRLGRKWFSPPGRNIYMSAVLNPEIAVKDATLLTLMASLACASALKGKSGLTVNIKWPNDLMVNGNKIGGILTELKSGGVRIKVAVIGIGININSRCRDFPEELRTRVTSLKVETGKDFIRGEIIAEILNELERWYMMLINEGRSQLLEEWKKLSSTLGNEVRVTIGRKVIAGFAEDIDEAGMLILRLSSGERRRISTGDLTELR